MVHRVPAGLIRIVRRALEIAQPSRRTNRYLVARMSEMEGRLEVIRSENSHLQAVVADLARDLDESRRLNLRAAELLDIVQSHLVDAPSRTVKKS